ncbi:MAG TPA: N-acetyltransferase [Flavobacteriaceae bacterium]|nr:GNAT family N-acetyltransferase [Flavobacteriaceae bacterium]MAY53783.1 GNAT family N-acetyltransferase [Flavobacteriaceae bacterium]HBR54652.1 N-acetyltransferase [Flavobacteriaceae bacterium]|tara:strand:+ start:73 stop:627 length:555 start_codon:yes stop_codon:yes gene_type:complete
MLNNNYILTTPRLGLRNWLPSDETPFVEMCHDTEVMRYFPSLLSAQESLALIERLKAHHKKHGFTYFAVDVLETGEFIGFCGLAVQAWQSEFTPGVDMGWRLKKSAWGKGYATEAAKTCLHAAEHTFDLQEVFAFTPDLNLSSQHVMKKIGLEFAGTFQHPKIANDNRFKTCVAYKKTFFKTEG